MRVQTQFQGENFPFEGDQTLWLRALPEHAHVSAATLTVEPARPNPVETVLVSNGATQGEAWGTTVHPASGNSFVEVDFHAPRTLAGLVGNPALNGARLQIDLGGVYVPVNADGSLTSGGTPFDFGTPLPGLRVSKFKISRAGGQVVLTEVMFRSYASNLTARIGTQPTFWLRPGELASAATSPDFAQLLNMYLGSARPENGYYAVPLILHTDSVARLNVTLTLDYVVEQPVLPPHLPELNIPYNYSSLPGIARDLLTVDLPRGAQPVVGRTGAQVFGKFADTRVAYGPLGEGPQPFAVPVSPGISLAQSICLEQEIHILGLDLPLGRTAVGLAGLHVAVQSDEQGRPSGTKLAEALVEVGKPLPDQSTWGSATLSAPLRLEAGVVYWLVLQSAIGSAYWNAALAGPSTVPLHATPDNGFTWRILNLPEAGRPLAALFRLRTKPEQFSIPLQLQIGRDPATIRRLDEFAPLGKIQFRFDYGAALQTHLDKLDEIIEPCREGELLENGSFVLPAPDNAARRLFGFDSGVTEEEEQAIIGTVDLRQGVDLSYERYLVISIGNRPPRRINIAGTNAVRTTLREIISIINSTLDREIADEFVETLPDETQRQTGRLMLRRLDIDDNAVRLHPWCAGGLPEGWRGSRGYAFRLIWPDGSGRVVAALIDPPRQNQPSEGGMMELGDIACFNVPTNVGPANEAFLAQRVSVTAGCSYLFQIVYLYVERKTRDDLASVGSVLARPFWEIFWYAADGQQLRADTETLAPTQPDPLNRAVSLPFSLFEMPLQAPEGAARAEVRVVHPSPADGMMIERMSFATTSIRARNGYFQQWEQSAVGTPTPTGWTHNGGLILRQTTGDAVRLIMDGHGPQDSVLVQRVPVSAGGQYELHIEAAAQARPDAVRNGSASIAQRARLELRWLPTPNGNSPVQIPLDDLGFAQRVYPITVPANASQIEIRLIQPHGTGILRVSAAALVAADRVRVPVMFLSEAPGDLAVSTMFVTYDPPGVQRPILTVPTTEELPIRRPASGAGGMGGAGGIPTGPESEPAAPAEPEEAHDERPLTAVRGIGPERARILAENGITSLLALSQSDPATVASMLPSVTTVMAGEFIRRARRLLHHEHGEDEA